MVKKLIPSALSKAVAALLLAAAWWSWGGQEMPGGMVRVTDRTAGGQPNVVPWLAGTEEMSARGDFDGDGALDEAYFVQRGETYALVATKSDAVQLLRNWAPVHAATPAPLTSDVIIEDLAPSREDHDRLKDELLPIVHDCPQVAVTIRAQDMTEDKLTKACIVLKETEDLFHATLQTDPARPIRGVELEVLAFSDPNDMNEYWKTVYSDGRDAGFSATYLFRRFEWTTAVALLGGVGYSTWAHEYIHHLDWTFNQTWYCSYPGGDGYLNLGPFEGLAGYIPNRNYGAAISVIGDGSNLPSLLDAWKYWEHDDRGTFQYGWGYVIVRFLFEEHPQVILTLYDLIRAADCSNHSFIQDLESYVDEVIPPLTDDFHKWAKSFTDLSRIRQIEPLTLFLDDDGNRVWGDVLDGYGRLVWREYFHTSRQDLSVSVSFSSPNVVGFSLSTGWITWGLYPLRIGSVEVTVTLTAPDGESAQQTFTVNVARDSYWQLKPIAVLDPVSTEDGYYVLDLSAYFTGPAVEESEFVAESHDPNIALAQIRGGHLVITAVSAGEVEITVRGDYHGRVGEQTFTIAVTNDCPSWLCKGYFTGWRAVLLQQAADSADTQALSETTHGP